MLELDKMIHEPKDQAERYLLRQIREEPGFIDQAFGVFGGRMGWVNAVLIVVQALLVLAGLWAAWVFYSADDPVTQLRWGLPAAVLLLMALIIKMAVWPAVQANWILREFKLIQLQLARRTRHADTPVKTME